MNQLDLFTLKPLLEIGKAYRFFYGWKNKLSVDYYIANMQYHGDRWDQYGSISYFIIAENKHESMKQRLSLFPSLEISIYAKSLIYLM